MKITTDLEYMIAQKMVKAVVGLEEKIPEGDVDRVFTELLMAITEYRIHNTRLDPFDYTQFYTDLS